MSERQWIFPIESKIDAILPDGTHRYWSTHCRHDNHEACASETISGRPLGDDCRWLSTPVEVERKPAQCKTCAAPCICPCHIGEADR